MHLFIIKVRFIVCKFKIFESPSYGVPTSDSTLFLIPIFNEYWWYLFLENVDSRINSFHFLHYYLYIL